MPKFKMSESLIKLHEESILEYERQIFSAILHGYDFYEIYRRVNRFSMFLEERHKRIFEAMIDIFMGNKCQAAIYACDIIPICKEDFYYIKDALMTEWFQIPEVLHYIDNAQRTRMDINNAKV